jgi:hypothetical protein
MKLKYLYFFVIITLYITSCGAPSTLNGRFAIIGNIEGTEMVYTFNTNNTFVLTITDTDADGYVTTDEISGTYRIHDGLISMLSDGNGEPFDHTFMFTLRGNTLVLDGFEYTRLRR